MVDRDIEFEQATEAEALWRLVTGLTGSLTSFQVAEAFTQDGALAVGASFANIALFSSDSQLVTVMYRPEFDPAVVLHRGTFDLSANRPACVAIRGGLPVLLSSLDEVEHRFPELLPEMEQFGLAARASMPIRSASDEPLGAVGFGWPVAQSFAADQLRRLDLVSQLIGLALERAPGGQPGAWQERLPRVLESMPSAFFSLDGGLIVTYINAEAERLLQTPRAEILGHNLLDVLPHVAGTQIEHKYRRALETGRSVVFEEYFAPSGDWFEVHAWPDRDGLNVYFSDVSERHAMERQQAIALEEAQQSNARLSFVTDLEARLRGVSTRSEMYARLSRAVIPTMADWTTIVIPVGEELVRVAASHRDPVLDGLAKRLVGGYPHHFSGPSPGVVVYKSAEPLRLDQLAEEIVSDLDDSVASAAYGRTLQLLGNGPGLIMPIASNGVVLAVLTLARQGGEVFSDSDVEVMTGVAARVASLLEDASHHESQRQAAHALQDAALPRTLPSSDQLMLAAGYRAASEGAHVGGDWYDAFELQTGHIALVVGDTAGHGLQAAALMTQLRNSLRAHLFDSYGPSDSIAKLNSFIATQEPDAFATVICVDVDPLSGEAIWASAGHPAPILLSADGTSVHLKGKAAPPIGSSDNPVLDEPDEHGLMLKTGDRLLLFTDGLYERRGVDLEIGLTHLMITVEQTRDAADAEAACEFVLAQLLSTERGDDVCLLIADFEPAVHRSPVT